MDENKNISKTFSIPPDLVKWLLEKAKKEDRPISRIVVEALRKMRDHDSA